MSATADPSCSELSEALQRNAKPRKRGDFRHPKDGLYAAKHEGRLSNIQLLQTAAHTLVCLRKASEDSVCCLSGQFIEVAGSFVRAQDDKRAGVFGRWSFGFKTSRFDYNRRTLINHFE